MAWYIVKIIITALIIVIVSEISKRLPLLGSLIASLPLISVLGMIWIFQETKNSQKLISHAEGTFWYVLPSLPMFLVMPWMMKKGISFYLSLGVGILLTIILYVIMTKLLSRFGLNI
jgi:F0F1-type ATP synthase assembly protein I